MAADVFKVFWDTIIPSGIIKTTKSLLNYYYYLIIKSFPPFYILV